MFSHVTIGVSDFGRSFAFYNCVLRHIGLEHKFRSPDDTWAAWGQPGSEKPLFIILRPYDDKPPGAGNGQMVAFLAQRRDDVDAFHAAALARGAPDEGAPGLRPDYHENYYGAYLRDLDGNKICVCCHGPEDT